MAREHPAVPKASSSQKKVQRFDGESSDDDEDTNVNKSNKVAMAKKQSSAKDMSRLFTRKVDEEEEPIKFYIVELDVEWGVVVELQAQIAECGGEVVDERPAEGYSLVDLRTDAGVLELSAHSTRTRRVVSYLFVEESIERGKLVPPLELNLFVKGDRPVKFHLHDSLPRNEIEDLRKDILLRGGNPDVALAEAQVVIHSRGFRDAPIAMRTWRQIELFETSDWLKSCMSMKRFAIAGAGGRLTVRPAPTVIPAAQPGRKVGAPRTEFTEHDDLCLVAWMAFQFGKNQTGRQGNKPYQLLVQDPNQLWWASRHTWHSWRERYKTKRVRFDPLIIQAVDEMEDNKTPRQRQRELRLPKFAVNEESDSDEQEDIPQAPAPSAAKAKPKRAKRKAHDRDDEDAQSSPPPVKQIKKSSTQVKMGTQPEKAPVIKTSASQKAREAPRFSTPPLEPPHSPPTPGPVSPPADEHMREASPVTGPGEEQEREDSQASTQLDTGILDQEVLGSGAQGAISRYNAELAQVASDEMEFEGDEGYTVDDPDVDVVGITQVDTSRSMTANGSHLEDSESRTGSSSESTQVGETEETLQDTVEQRLNALADRFGSRYSMVEAYYEYAVANGEPDIYEYVERQLRANLRQEKGKGRASG